MEYQIISFDESVGQIVVECSEGITFALDLPIENGLYPEGDELDTLIKQFLPTWVIHRKQIIASGVSNVNNIKKIIVPKDIQPTQQLNAKIQRKMAYQVESDPLFFKAQRGESTMEEWISKINEIKERYPDISNEPN